MKNSTTRTDHQTTLEAVESRLVENKDDPALLFQQACLLASLGRIDEAKQAYLKLLSADQTHLGALNNLGAILYGTGYRSAAKTVYTQAVTHHPENAMAYVNLANLLFDENDMVSSRRHYEEALRADPDQAEAHQGLTRIFSAMRDEAGVQRHRERGFRHRAVTTLPYFGKGPPIQLLLLVAAEGGNIPLRQNIDNRIFMTTAVFADFYDVKKPLPPHQLVFNSIGDADLCGTALEAAAVLLENTSAPVINPPDKIIPTTRVEIARRLAPISGVRTPETGQLKKNALINRKIHDLQFPLLLRAPGFHTGQHFLKVDELPQLSQAIAQLPGEDVLVMQYLDARGSDGLARKYRVMMIDGKFYPLHLAVSRDWKVHYFTADMSAQPQYREEEKKFLEDMPAVLGKKAMAALEQIKDVLGLDYGGIDFGLDTERSILLFEANATMVINPPLPQEPETCRSIAIEKAAQALRNMLQSRALKRESI